MRLIFTKGSGKQDRLDIVRVDGTGEIVPQPKQRIIPHDMVHFVVEEQIDGGFLALVADGAAAGFAGGSGSTRAEPIERLVETLQADAWGAPATPDEIVDAYEAACTARGHPAAAVTPGNVAAMLDRMMELQLAWDAVPVGGSLELTFTRPADPR